MSIGGRHDSGCDPGCKDSHDASDGHSKDYWGGWDNPDRKESSCFPASAKILTPTGVRNIGSVEVGDTVLSYNAGRLQHRRVTRKLVHAPTALAKVEFEDSGSLCCTPNHTFLTDGGWKQLRELSPGAVLKTPTGDRSVKLIAMTGASEAVFNLYTEGEHNFIADGCVAHNFSHFRQLRTVIHRLVFDGLPGAPARAQTA